MTRQQYAALTISALIASLTAVAVSSKPQTPTAPLPTAQKEGIIIRPGDDLYLDQRFNNSSCSGEAVVSPYGCILDERNDAVQVAGLTVPQAEAAVKNALAPLSGPDRDGGPRVRITLQRHHMIQVCIFGAGFFNLPAKSRLSSLLQVAPPQRGADLSHVELWQTPDTRVFVNYRAYLAHKKAADNPILQNGAEVIIGPIQGQDAPTDLIQK